MEIDSQLHESGINAGSTAFNTSDEGYPARTTPHRIPFPPAWYYFGSVAEMRRGPVSREIIGQRLVGFLTKSGQPGVLSRHCVHMGSDLSEGCVVGESLQCALHHWRFGPDGNCVEIPATENIPEFAGQNSFPAIIRHDSVYFFNRRAPLYPLPFFNGFEPDELVAAKPFVEHVECPWYMVGANAVDVQHFAIAHDRKMQRPPEVDHPHAHQHRTVCHFDIVGTSFSDRLTKRFGGPEVKLEIVDWGSTMILARSTLAKTETFGMLSVVPLTENRCMGHVTVLAKPGSSAIGRTVLDPLRATIRRLLIRTFLRADVGRLAGTRYSPQTLIGIDDQFAEYFHWLKSLPQSSTENPS